MRSPSAARVADAVAQPVAPLVVHLTPPADLAAGMGLQAPGVTELADIEATSLVHGRAAGAPARSQAAHRLDRLRTLRHCGRSPGSCGIALDAGDDI